MVGRGIAVAPGLVYEETRTACESVVAGNNQAPLARRDVLPLLETEAADRANRADDAPSGRGEIRLSAVFDHWQVVPSRQSGDFRHLARITEEVCDHHGLRPGAEAGRDSVGGDIAGARVDIGEHRNRALIEDGRDRTHVGDRAGDNLIARLRVERGHCRVDGCRSRRAGNRMTDVEHPGKLLREALDNPTFGGRERPAFEDFPQARELVLTESSTGTILI